MGGERECGVGSEIAIEGYSDTEAEHEQEHAEKGDYELADHGVYGQHQEDP